MFDTILNVDYFVPFLGCERLFFVWFAGKLFAVMAYTQSDALRQVEQARFSAMWGYSE